MLKSRRATIVLLVSVLLIWTFIGVKFYKAMRSPDTNVVQSLDSVSHIPQMNVFEYDVVPPQVDPFLGKLSNPSANKSVEINKQKKSPASPVIKSTVPWPTIVYKGIIKNKLTGKTLASLSINGKDNFLKNGDEEQGVRLLLVGKDSVQVVYGGEKRYLLRAQN